MFRSLTWPSGVAPPLQLMIGRTLNMRSLIQVHTDLYMLYSLADFLFMLHSFSNMFSLQANVGINPPCFCSVISAVQLAGLSAEGQTFCWNVLFS